MARFTNSDVCTSKKAAALLGVTSRTIQLWAESGVLRSWKTPGGHRRYSVDAVKALAKDIQETGEPELRKAAGNSLKILVVEDDTVMLKLYKITVDSWQLPVELELASDGYSGMLKVGAFQPDLMLLDLSLPNIDGFKIVESLTSNGQLNKMKLVVVSGLPFSEIKQRLQGIDENSILSKPVPFDKIRKITEELIAQS